MFFTILCFTETCTLSCKVYATIFYDIGICLPLITLELHALTVVKTKKIPLANHTQRECVTSASNVLLQTPAGLLY